MNDISESDAKTSASSTETKPKKPGFTFTNAGCRTEVRAGALLTLMGVFLWQFSLPWAQRFLLIGLPLLAIGIPLQALDARRIGRPGYPWKLAIAFTVIGLALLPDQFYREEVGGELKLVMPWVPALILAGIWMLAWWPVARRPATLSGMDDAA